MANIGAKIGMKVLTIAVGIPVGIATRKAVERVWVATGPDRPDGASNEGLRWVDAVSWAALTGFSMALADLLTRKGAEEIYHTVVGKRPPVTAKPSASRHVRKADPKHPEAIAPPA